ncbi:MAG: 3'-5' exoribonuclease [Sphaerochaeta sp.]|jgi:DNA polymerase-3 subunit epsilon|nr:3'-5' exoribonuclease [Sphaerochaeta sp.]
MMEYVALDFETANGYPGGGCAIGLARFDMDGNVLDHYYSLIHPKVEYFDGEMTNVHQLKKEDCLAAPSFPDLWPDIRSFIGHNLVVAHFAQFDMGVLKDTLEAYELSSGAITYLCTFNLAKKVWPKLPTYKLSYLVQYLGLVDQYHEHYAMDDAVMCGKLMHKECASHLAEPEDLAKYLEEKQYKTKVIGPYENNLSFFPM